MWQVNRFEGLSFAPRGLSVLRKEHFSFIICHLSFIIASKASVEWGERSEERGVGSEE